MPGRRSSPIQSRSAVRRWDHHTVGSAPGDQGRVGFERVIPSMGLPTWRELSRFRKLQAAAVPVLLTLMITLGCTVRSLDNALPVIVRAGLVLVSLLVGSAVWCCMILFGMWVARIGTWIRGD